MPERPRSSVSGPWEASLTFMNPRQTSHCCLVSNHMSTEPQHAGQPPRSPSRGGRAPTLTGKVRGPTLRRQQTAPEDGHWARWQDTQGVHSCGSTSSPQTSRPWSPSRDPAAHSEPCPCSRGPHPAPCREGASHVVEDWTRASLEHEPKPDVPPAGLDEGRQPCPVDSSVQNICYKGQACRLDRVRLCTTPWTVAHQAPLSMGCSR